ncbi:hypothetical protein VNI00_009050 [Paramarasmius palmivorus]|uniref:Amine oxidase n=1 Tax=Paramarasmius palmivorus TaxID=297713 RepID=A0AAW0CSZ2_9AGAR
MSTVLLLLWSALFSGGAFALPSQANHTVLILGGGVAGVIAARTLHTQGINDFLILEARDELGGRMMSHKLGNFTVELGANWIQGTQTDGGPANPIFELAEKHGVKTQLNDLYGSISFYNSKGPANFSEDSSEADNYFEAMVARAGERVDKSLVDLSARSGYSLSKARPLTPEQQAAEYFDWDFEYAQTPEESSWVAGALNNNYTYVVEQGGFSEDNLLSIDQRGFKYLIQAEAQSFLKAGQVQLNSVVSNISYSDSGVMVTLKDGRTYSGSYAICTFSLGVLQWNDVLFEPQFPDWKLEAIQSSVMATYTKIFLRFSEKFWFDTEMGLYADPERGRYTIWQSLDHVDFLPGSKIIFVTVTGDFSERIEALPDDQVRAEVLSVLGTMFPNRKLPHLEDFYFQRWHSDPLYRGTYSNWPPSFLPEHFDNLRANVDRLWFAGEATSFKYFGFLHGAYFEGRDIASQVAKCVKGGGCVDLKRTEAVKNPHPYLERSLDEL